MQHLLLMECHSRISSVHSDYSFSSGFFGTFRSEMVVGLDWHKFVSDEPQVKSSLVIEINRVNVSLSITLVKRYTLQRISKLFVIRSENPITENFSFL